MTWGQKFRKLTAERLEELAIAEFSEKIILEVCRTRADQGFNWAEVRPSRPVDVSKTEAAMAMRTALAKQQLRLEWEPVRERSEAPAFMVLRISWER